jgi:hypothetical protein
MASLDTLDSVFKPAAQNQPKNDISSLDQAFGSTTPPKMPPGGLSAFVPSMTRTLAESNPTAVADSLEGLSYMMEGEAPDINQLRNFVLQGNVPTEEQVKALPIVRTGDGEPLRDAAKWIRRNAVASPTQPATQDWSQFFDEPLTTLAERGGEAVGSSIPSIIAGTVGAVGGEAIAGPPGGIAGGLTGAGSASYLLNHGDLYASLKEAGLAPKTAAQWAFYGAVPITGLDIASPMSIVNRLTGSALPSAWYKKA